MGRKKEFEEVIESFTDCLGNEVKVGDYYAFGIKVTGFGSELRYGKVTEIKVLRNARHSMSIGRGYYEDFTRDDYYAKLINVKPTPEGWKKDANRWRVRINEMGTKILPRYIPPAALKLLK